MNESDDRKGGTAPPRPSSPDIDDDLARTRSNEGDAQRNAPLVNESEMTLIMERAKRVTGPRMGQLPPAQLPPFKLPTTEPPPAVSIADQSEFAPPRSPGSSTASEMEALRPSGFELGRPVFAVIAIAAILAGGGWFSGGQPVAMGVGIGGLTAALNLWFFTRLGRAMVAQGGGRWGLLATLKLLVLFGGVFYILKHEIASPLSFLIGYLALPIGIVASQFLGLRADFESGEGSL